MSRASRYEFHFSLLISSLSFAICWAQVSFALTVVVQTAGALDAESSSVISMAVSEPVVECVVVDGVDELEGRPGHSRAI